MRTIAAVASTLFLSAMMIVSAQAADTAKPKAAKPAAPKESHKDLTEPGPFMGEYEGTMTPKGETKALVYGTGGDAYKVVLLLPEKQGAEGRVEMTGKAENDKKLMFAGSDWSGTLEDQKIVIQKGDAKFEGKFTVRKSPTEGQKPPKDAIVLLPFEEGKETNLDAWTNKNWKLLPTGAVQVASGDNRTTKEFSDFQLHIEFMLPYVPTATGQARGNSGLFLMDRYEIQVLDSFGLLPQYNDCGAVYTIQPPLTNACLPPLRWQTYDITFHAPRLDDTGKVAKKAVVTVLQNGVKIHDNFEIPHPTGSAKKMAEVKAAPFRLQDHGNPTKFRNMWVVELKE